MPLVKKLSKLGNSTAVVIDKPLLRQLDLDPEGEVELRVSDNALIITPHRYASNDEFGAAKSRVMQRRRKLMERLAKR
jgi:antitoxin component of MazEF toxin-antitoxin module